MEPSHYLVPRALFVPTGLALATLGLAWTNTPWFLLALPFIYLGSVCAAPNMNLVNGFLALVAMAFGLAVGHFYREAGGAIFIGTFVSWFFSAMEKRIRAVPVYDDHPKV